MKKPQRGFYVSPILFGQTLKSSEMKCKGIGIPIRNDNLFILNLMDYQVDMAKDEELLSLMIRKLEEDYLQ